ncbi:MAG: TrmH family RNA methyltransferase [Thermodesulfobacteriota bacterium]|nr:TrmH family RNA methyltransferase [Thermodesulfobacteriota bacterium]
MSLIDLSQLVVVLVAPRQPGNIGAVCRAMANFGVLDLRLVTPCDRFHPEAVKFAVDAKPLLGQAQLYETLPDALADLTMSVALTRRCGRLRGKLHPVSHVAPLITSLPADSKIGLVFGREDCGLSTDEVAQCTRAATITTSGSKGARGSLNLAQAVVVTLYELSREPSIEVPLVEEVNDILPTQQDTDALMCQVDRLIHRVGYSNPSRPEVFRAMLSNLMVKARPSKKELNMLRGLVEQLSQSVQDWPGRRRG